MNIFPFDDLHGFKDYITFVQMCAPDNFPKDFTISGENWTLDLSFEGLRFGLDIAIEEKGPKPVFDQCRQLVEQAYHHYKVGEEDEGWYALEEVRKLLRKVRTQ